MACVDLIGVKKNFQTNNGRWAKGTSGNPSGRPPGSRNKATLIIEQLLEDESEQLARKLINLAKEGDIAALRLCIDRLAPVPKERNIHLDLLPGHTAEELAANSQRVLTAIGQGWITPGEGQALSQILQDQSRALELVELDRRIKEVESAQSEVVNYRRDLERFKEDFVNELKRKQSEKEA